jgi:hypothetical protein
MKILLVGMLSLLLFTVGLVSNELGFTAPVIKVGAPPPITDNVEAPEQGFWGSLFQGVTDVVTAVATPFVWAFNAVASIFQLLTFQVDELNSTLNGFISIILGMIIFMIIVLLIRGTD